MRRPRPRPRDRLRRERRRSVGQQGSGADRSVLVLVETSPFRLLVGLVAEGARNSSPLIASSAMFCCRRMPAWSERLTAVIGRVMTRVGSLRVSRWSWRPDRRPRGRDTEDGSCNYCLTDVRWGSWLIVSASFSRRPVDIVQASTGPWKQSSGPSTSTVPRFMSARRSCTTGTWSTP